MEEQAQTTAPRELTARDEEVFRRFLGSRNPQFLEELVRRYQRRAYQIAWGVSGNQALAEESVQEAFLTLNQQREFQDLGPGAFRAWFYKLVLIVARNQTRSELRSRQRPWNPTYRARHPTVTPPNEGLDTFGREEYRQLLRDAVSALPEELRLTVVLHFLCGLSQKDVASNLGVNASVVSRRIARGLSQLRHRMAAANVAVSATGLTEALLGSDWLPGPPGSPGALTVPAPRAQLDPAALLHPEWKSILAGGGVALGLASLLAIGLILAQRDGAPVSGAGGVFLRSDGGPVAKIRVESTGRVAPALPLRWSFENGPPGNLVPVAGSWNWQAPAGGCAGSMRPQEQGVCFLLPLDIPQEPILLTLTSDVIDPGRHFYSGVRYGSSPEAPLEPFRLWSRPREINRGVALRQRFFFIGRYIVSYTEARVSAVADFSSRGRVAAVSLINQSLVSLELRHPTPGEWLPELEDIPALVESLRVTPVERVAP